MLRFKKLTLFVLVIFGGFSFMVLFPSTSSATAYKEGSTNDSIITNNSKFQKHTKMVCNVIYKKHKIENSKLSHKVGILKRYSKALKKLQPKVTKKKDKKLVKYLITILDVEVERINNELNDDNSHLFDLDDENNNEDELLDLDNEFTIEYNRLVDDIVSNFKNVDDLKTELGNSQILLNINGKTSFQENNVTFKGDMDMKTNGKQKFEELALISKLSFLVEGLPGNIKTIGQEVDVIVKNGNVYTKINKSSYPGMPSELEKNIGKWIKVDYDDRNSNTRVVELKNMFKSVKKDYIKKVLKDNPVLKGKLIEKNKEFKTFEIIVDNNKLSKLLEGKGYFRIDSKGIIKGIMKVYSDGKRDFKIDFDLRKEVKGQFTLNKNGEGQIIAWNPKNKENNNLKFDFLFKEGKINFVGFIHTGMKDSDITVDIKLDWGEDFAKGKVKIDSQLSNFFIDLNFNGKLKKLSSLTIEEPKDYINYQK